MQSVKGLIVRLAHIPPTPFTPTYKSTMALLRLPIVLAACFLVSVHAFVTPGRSIHHHHSPTLQLAATSNGEISRQDWIKQSVAAAAAVFLLPQTEPALAASADNKADKAERKPLEACLYSILRVREATVQESRLVTTGKFKDVQRANVKLACKFILNNYRLSNTLITASAYLESNEKRVAAVNVGQSAVQDLQTILEYFDSGDVQNIKVGGENMAGKEKLVLQGLESARKNLDGFVSYFPSDKVETARKQILEENALNYKEWDPTLGDIVNLPPAV